MSLSERTANSKILTDTLTDAASTSSNNVGGWQETSAEQLGT